MEKENLRIIHLRREAKRYVWWFGASSQLLRKCIDLSGWRLSRKMFRMLGKPKGAWAWPLSTAFLCLNASDAAAAREAHWIHASLLKLRLTDRVLDSRQPHVDVMGLFYAALKIENNGHVARGTYWPASMTAAESLLHRPGADRGRIAYTLGKTAVLVDTIAFICPFLARVSKISGDKKYLKTAVLQIRQFASIAKEPVSGLYFHGFDSITELPCGMLGWARGMGWLLLGIADTLTEMETLDEDHLFLLQEFEDSLNLLMALQKEDGHWPWDLMEANATSDSSLTAMVCYSALRIKKWLAPATEVDAMIQSAMAALETSTDEEGRVCDASGEAGGLGEYSIQFGPYLWAQGPAVAADGIRMEIMQGTQHQG